MSNELIVDHRYAHSQIRYRLLQQLCYNGGDLEWLSETTGLSGKQLAAVCLGRSGLTYGEMAALVKVMLQSELLVTFPWMECGQSIAEDEPCAEDAKCEDMLKMCQEDGKVPRTVWQEKNK